METRTYIFILKDNKQSQPIESKEVGWFILTQMLQNRCLTHSPSTKIQAIFGRSHESSLLWNKMNHRTKLNYQNESLAEVCGNLEQMKLFFSSKSRGQDKAKRIVWIAVFCRRD